MKQLFIFPAYILHSSRVFVLHQLSTLQPNTIKLWSFSSAAKSLLYLTAGMCYKAAGHTNTPQGKLSVHNGVLSFIARGFGCIIEAGCHEWGMAGVHYGQKLLAPLVCPDTDHTHHLLPVLCHFEENNTNRLHSAFSKPRQ